MLEATMWTESGRETDGLSREEFVGHLRDALNHLHDLERLRKNPLAGASGEANRFDAASWLRQTIIQAVKALEPDGSEPTQSPAWRAYDLLLCCYVQQLSQKVVALQLGVSDRQLRRERDLALDLLADHLWSQFDPQRALRTDGNSIAPAVRVDAPEAMANAELSWLQDSPLEQPTDLGQTLSTVLDRIKPIADRHRVYLRAAQEPDFPSLAIHPVAAQQTLLSLLGVAIHRAPGGRVSLSTRVLRWEVEVTVRGESLSAPAQSILSDDAARLDMAHRLVSMSGGRLAHAIDGPLFCARVSLPTFDQLPVLVIDDNTDTLKLFQRYMSGSRYRFLGTKHPEEGSHLAETCSPQVILLDVMMPQMDGWSVLAQLRKHPQTARVPIIVCTVLAEEELALSLGASHFLRKPVTRQQFLAILNHFASELAVSH
jgi:CheY-like chemotaxis protein